MATERIDDRIAEVSRTWADDFVAARKTALSARKITASGDLSRSIEAGVTKGGEQGAVTILIAFNDYGRIVEMRRINHDKWGRNAVTRVEDWIREKGISRFVPGFMQRHPEWKTTPKDVVNRAAWGILVSRSANKFRRRPWWNKAKTASVSSLYNQVATATADATMEELKESFDFQKYARVTGRQ